MAIIGGVFPGSDSWARNLFTPAPQSDPRISEEDFLASLLQGDTPPSLGQTPPQQPWTPAQGGGGINPNQFMALYPTINAMQQTGMIPQQNQTPGALSGIQAVEGGTATVGGQKYVAQGGQWVPQSQATQQTGGGGPANQNLLGFTPNYLGATSPVVNEGGQIVGNHNMNTTHYLDQPSANQLASLLGAQVEAANVTGLGTSVPQYELVFQNGARLNAGLVADMFQRDPARAMARLQAEVHQLGAASPGNVNFAPHTSQAYAAPYTPPSAQALGQGVTNLNRGMDAPQGQNYNYQPLQWRGNYGMTAPSGMTSLNGNQNNTQGNYNPGTQQPQSSPQRQPNRPYYQQFNWYTPWR